jgi:hypothetical protein
MQFIPSTWSVVGVDADGDGVRNPQDIDDAALGTAVYLCSGSDDLGNEAGQRAAVYRYNHSQSYVDLVLAIMDAYLQGDFTSIPNGTVMAGQITKTPPPLHVPGTPAHQAEIKPPANQDSSGDTPVTDGGAGAPTTPQPPTAPGGGGSTGGGGGGGNGGGGGVHVPSAPVSVPPLPSTSVPPVDQVLTLAQATAQCALDGINELLEPQKFQQCVNDYMS